MKCSKLTIKTPERRQSLNELEYEGKYRSLNHKDLQNDNDDDELFLWYG